MNIFVSNKMEYVFPSLLFVKDNISKTIEDIHYYNGYNTNSTNFLTISIVLNECHRIMVSNDIYCKNNVKLIVTETIKQYLTEYKREHKHSEIIKNFNFDEEVSKIYTTFWNLVSQILN
jgi:hypothetical protein